MVLIKKQEPASNISENIRQVRAGVARNPESMRDAKIMRAAFNQLDKHAIRVQLLKEQKGLCAYCMRRIRNDEHTVIEHLRPVDSFPEGALSYENMMACCDGGRSLDVKPHILCCDAAKGNALLTISPYNQEQIRKIRYDRNGRIYTYPQDQQLDHDINYKLMLNGELDENGELINDTATRLVYGRKQVYRDYETLIKGLSKRNKNIKSALLKRKQEILDTSEYPEYAGVWLYYINRKLRSA